MQVGPNIVIPDEILVAAKKGKLVIFAGAGVSKAAPSDLPLFEPLAHVVGDLFQTPRLDDEGPDVYLGRLHSAGLDVHSQVERLVTPAGSTPNEIHELLLTLSMHNGQPKIVTTNFDHHFETAAAAMMDDPLRIYAAPALPLGEDFSGLVYLHGRALSGAYRVVVTDSDFGEAYLVKGWATTFLREMFREYVVVFVGYSHDDAVMSYLGRGLPPQSVRFALTRGTSDAAKWSHRRVKPVSYIEGESDQDHAGLPALLRSWNDYASLGYGEIAQYVKALVESPLQPGDDTWLLEDRFSEAPVTAYVRQYARDVSWLSWAEERSLLDELFVDNQPYSERHSDLASWFRHYVWTHPHRALEVVQRRGGTLSPSLWYDIARDIAVGAWTEGVPIDPGWKLLWTGVLLQSARPRPHRHDPFTSALLRLDPAAEWPLFEMLLEDQMRPRLKLQRSFFTYFDEDSERRVDLAVELTGDEYMLSEAWSKKVRPVIEQRAAELERLITNGLRHATSLMRPMDDEADVRAMAYSVDRISSVDIGDHNREDGRLLIIAARDVIDALERTAPDECLRVSRVWFSESSVVMKRLALHGLSSSSKLTADEKLAHLLEHDLLFGYLYKPEVFHLLRCLPDASPAMRQQVLDAVDAEYQRAAEADDSEYEAYNLAYWLTRVAPSDDTNGLFGKLQRLMPDKRPRDEPDVDMAVRSGSWEDDRGVETHAEFPRMNLEARVAWLTDVDEPNDIQVETVFEFSRGDFDGSLELAGALVARNYEDARIWRAILRSWSEAAVEERASDVLARTDFIAERQEMWEDLARLYQHIGKSGLDEISLVSAAAQVLRLLVACERLDLPRPTVQDDWLHVAINHPGGRLAEAAMMYFYRARSLDLAPFEIPVLRELRDHISDRGSDITEVASVIVLGSLSFFLATDVEWAEERLLPAFAADGVLADQAWHGFLYLSRPTAELFDRLRPLYLQWWSSHEKPEERRDKIGERFAIHLVIAAFYSSSLPENWFDEIVVAFSAEDLVQWIHEVDRTLGALAPQQADALWLNFLQPYWVRRNEGIPRSLDAQEVAAMTGWLEHLGDHYSDAVGLYLASPEPELERDSDLWILAESDLVAAHPNEVARLADRLMLGARGQLHGHVLGDRVEHLVDRLIEAQAEKDHLIRLCETLAGWGYPGAVQLRVRVDAM